MFRNRVLFSDIPSRPLLFSFPKKNEVIDLSRIESIVINPARFYESIRLHFDGYLKSLRDGSDKELKHAFETTVKLKWALDEKDRAIGMTEEDFFET